MDLLLQIILALFFGVIIGIERDSSWQSSSRLSIPRYTFIKPGKPAKGLGGVRTFSLISLVGFVSGLAFSMNPALAFIGVISFSALCLLIGISYFLNYFDKNTFGLTTEVSMFILFILSFLLGTGLVDYRILLAITVIISLILSLKIELRNLISTFTRTEIIESLEFVLLTLVVFPFLPNVSITLQSIYNYMNISGPLGQVILFNPQQLWLVVIFVTSLSYIGYFLVKLLRSNQSLLLTGFLGGLVSSTTVTHLMGLKSKEVSDKPTQDLLVAIALVANSTSFIRIPLIILAINYNLFTATILSMILMAIVGFGFSLFSSRDTGVRVDSQLIFKSPLALKSAFTFALLFISVQIVTQVALIVFGDTGFVVSTLIASMSGLDAVSINTANSVPTVVPLVLGSVILITATIANLVGKSLVALFAATTYFTKRLSLFFALISICGIIGLLITIL